MDLARILTDLATEAPRILQARYPTIPGWWIDEACQDMIVWALENQGQVRLELGEKSVRSYLVDRAHLILRRNRWEERRKWAGDKDGRRPPMPEREHDRRIDVVQELGLHYQARGRKSTPRERKRQERARRRPSLRLTLEEAKALQSLFSGVTPAKGRSEEPSED